MFKFFAAVGNAYKAVWQQRYAHHGFTGIKQGWWKSTKYAFNQWKSK